MSSPDPLATFLSEELQALRADWTQRTTSPALLLPQWTWEDLKEAMLNLAPIGPVSELLVRGGLSALIKTASEQSAEELLESLLRLAASVQDPSFQRLARDTLEADMT